MAKSKSFEASVDRLEQIVSALEKGDLSLDASIKLFQEGTGLVNTCTKLLDEAELTVVKLTKGSDGAPVETEFSDVIE